LQCRSLRLTDHPDMPVRFRSLLAHRGLNAHVLAERIITPIRFQARTVRRTRASVRCNRGISSGETAGRSGG
jgi:hypothetical protein